MRGEAPAVSVVLPLFGTATLIAQELVAAVPGEVLRRRPVRGVGGEGELAALHAGQEEGGLAGLGEVLFCDEDGVVVPDGPEAVVEEPVGVLGEGDAVVQGVVAAAGELVDVGGVDDGAGGELFRTVFSLRTREVT